jgi:membrane protein
MWTLIQETFVKWYADNPGQRGAALAFYALFAIAPLLIIAVAISGSVFGIHATENQVSQRDIVGPEVARPTVAPVDPVRRTLRHRHVTLLREVGIG